MTRTKDWLQYSEELIEVADLLITNRKFNWSCFTSQQASSAALKAILENIEESTFGDNLIALLRIIKDKKSVPKEVNDACHSLNDYFKSTRDLERNETGTPMNSFSEKEAKHAKDNALIILRFAYREVN
ncbi:MAG: HEPN domain-containing protein [Candidatus Thorarchaeota archaeon]